MCDVYVETRKSVGIDMDTSFAENGSTIVELRKLAPLSLSYFTLTGF